MRHYVIFECNHDICEFRPCDIYVDWSMADEMCSSMNNFSKPPYKYYLRCLDDYEFEHINEYDPFVNEIYIADLRHI